MLRIEYPGLKRISALTWRQIRQTAGYIGPNVVKMLRPAGYLLLSIGIGGSVGRVSYGAQMLDYIDFLLPGLLAMLAFDAFGETLFRAANEKQWGVFRMTAMHGVSPIEYIASHTFHGIAWYLVKAAALVLIAALFGAHVGLAALLPTLIWGVIGVMTWTAAGLALGIRVDSWYFRDMLSTLVTFPVIFASSAFYDLARAPVALRWVAGINPLSSLATLMRDTALSVGIRGSDAAAVAACCVAALLLALITVRRTPLVAADR